MSGIIDLVTPAIQIPDSMRVSSRLRGLLDPDAGTQTASHEGPSSPVSFRDSRLRGEQDNPPYEASLHQLAAHVVDAADQHGQTPIFVAGRLVVLHSEFYVALGEKLVNLAGRPVRFEILSPSLVGVRGMFLRRRHRRQLKRIVDAVPSDVEVREANRISRPAGTTRPLFVGVVSHPLLLSCISAASCFRLLLLEAGQRTTVPDDIQATIQRFSVSAIN
ncbi:MAG: hypothetical protein R3C05_03730 [Pirellulaceae bacterium]